MDNLDYYRVEKAIQYLETNFKQQPELKDIAGSLGLSEFHFQKMFKKWAGISPKKFLQFLTLEYTKEKLREGEIDQPRLLTDVTFDSGLSSTSRIHELFVNVEAITPKEFKSMGENLTIYYGQYYSQFGLCMAGITDKGICSLQFIDDPGSSAIFRDELKQNWPNAKIIEDRNKTQPYFDVIFNGKNDKKINIVLKGTNFQIQVWKALLKVPEGKLTTYESIAQSINNPKALRAVGSAVGDNPISFLIPCHRVINKIGVIGKYRWGTARKKAIIGWEAARATTSDYSGE